MENSDSSVCYDAFPASGHLKPELPRRGAVLVLVFILSTLCGCDLAGDDEPLYTQEEIDYFREIAFGSEFGASPEEGVIMKWTQDVTVHVTRERPENSEETLRQVMSEINNLVSGVIELRLNLNPFDFPLTGVMIHFVSREEFRDHVPVYARHGDAYFSVRSDSSEIQAAAIYIATGSRQQRIAHLIREELTQILGLMQDSHTYPESIFYQGASDVTSYAEIDRALIEMLYRPEIRPGMTREQATAVLRNLER